MHRWDDFASDDFEESEDDMLEFDGFDDDEDDMPMGKGVSSEWNDFDEDDADDDYGMPSAKMVSASFIDVAAVVEEAEFELDDYVLSEVDFDEDDMPRAKGSKGVSSEWNDFDEDDDEYVGPKSKSHDLSEYQLASVYGG